MEDGLGGVYHLSLALGKLLASPPAFGVVSVFKRPQYYMS